MTTPSPEITFREIAQPTARLPLVNCPRLFLQKERLLATVNYSSEGRDTRLFLTNVDTLETEWVSAPDGQFQAYGFVQGADGLLYLGFSGGKISSFDPATKAFQLVADPFPEDNFLTWGACASRAGKVYMGVYPNGAFTEYDIATGSHRVHFPLPAETKGVYAQEFLELPDGRIFLFLKGADPEILIYNPSTGDWDLRKKITAKEQEYEGREILAVLDEERVIYAATSAIKIFHTKRGEWEDDYLKDPPEILFGLTWINGTLFAAGSLNGNLYTLTPEGYTGVETGLHSGNRFLGKVHQIAPDRMIGLGDNGLLTRFSLQAGGNPPETRQLDTLSANGLNLHLLKKDPESHLVVGSHFINSQIFRLDLESGECQPSLEKVSPVSGQVTCASFLNGVAYLGVYTQAVVLSYRPGEPFAFGGNPRVLTKIGHKQNRPMGLFNDGKQLFMVTRAKGGYLGGAISVINPQTASCEVFRNFVPAQNPVSVYFHNGCLIGTTEIRGDQGSCLPEAKNALIYVWDTRTREVIRTATPWPTESLWAHGLSPDGRLIGFENGKYFLFEPGSGDLKIRDWEHATPEWGVYLNERHFLTSLPAPTPKKHTLLLLDTEENRVSTLGESDPIRFYERLDSGEILVSLAGYRVATLRLSHLP